MQAWRDAGFCVLPLPENGKRCYVKDWPELSQQELWANAPEDYNLAVRLGGPLQTAVLDGDNEYAVKNIADSLRGMGAPFICTTTATPSHRHFYINMMGAPSGESWRKLSQSIGSGEFRFGSGAYVVAPSSIVNGQRYSFVNSTDGPHDIASLRRVHFKDFARAFLSDAVARSERIHIKALPVQLIKRDLPTSFYKLLGELNTAESGAIMGKYASRSEAEFAVILSAIRAGWNFDEVAQLFDEWQPGHYADSKNPSRYLQTTWNNALSAFASEPTRQEIANMIANAPRYWPGRGGALDAATYNALLAMAYAKDALTFNASIRQICELSGASFKGAYNSLLRLRSSGVVVRTGLDADYGTSGWTIKTGGVSISNHPTQYYTSEGSQELWPIMGRSSMLVYEELDEKQAFCAKILAKTSGKCLNTVKTALKKLAKYGLAQQIDGGWKRGARPLSEVVVEFGCADRAALRRHVHNSERDKYYRRNVSEKLEFSKDSE
jgi:hypothetical protein